MFRRVAREAAEARMRAVIVVVGLGLLPWMRPASADPPYALTVSRHPSVRDFSENEVKQLLRTASTVMRNAGCPVTFTLEGAVRTFSSANVPNNIVTEADLDKVHGEPT